MFKKIFCKHHYEYYHRGKYMPLFAVSLWDKWHFICKKCGKTSILYDYDLHELWKEISEKVSRENAMGIDNSQYDNLVFRIGYHNYSGKGAYYMKQNYKNYHQDKTVTLY